MLIIISNYLDNIITSKKSLNFSFLAAIILAF